MKTTIVIPTYWDRKSGSPKKASDQIFDHPTPLDSEGTLGRCIESIVQVLDSKRFQIVVLYAVTAGEIERDVERAVRRISEAHRGSCPILCFGGSELEYLRSRARALGGDPSVLSLKGYGHIRNCQLLVPLLLGSEAIIAIDDDEIVDDPGFLEKALEFLTQQEKGRTIDGISGYYRSPEGDCRLYEAPEASSTDNLFLRKDRIQNLAHTELLEKEGNPVFTRVAYGGIMAFSREMASAVPHDPLVARGEDIDYLMNCSLYGYNWFFHKDFSIIHKPPGSNVRGAHSSPSYARLHQDVMRFFYKKEKLKAAARMPELRSLSVEELGIYPGSFLSARLEDDALQALREKRNSYEDAQSFPSAEKIVGKASSFARENALWYFSFAEEWRRVLSLLNEDQETRQHVGELLR